VSKIGSIYVEVRGDYSKYKEDLRVVQAESKKMGEQISNTLNNAISPSQASSGISSLSKNLHNLALAAKVPADNFAASASRITQSLGQVAEKAGLTRDQFQKLNEKMLQTQAAHNAEKALSAISRQAGLTSSETLKLGTQMGMGAASLAKFEDAAKKGAGGANLLTTSFSRLIAIVGAYGFVSSLTQITKSFFDAGQSWAQVSKAFSEIHGAEGAAQEFAFLRAEADRLGQNFYDLVEAYKKFSAAAKEAGMSIEVSRKIFDAFTQAGATLGLRADVMKGVFLALEQMTSRGVVAMEELRGQLGERLPGAIGIAAKSLGMTEAALMEAVKTGNILAKDLLPRMADALKDRFSGELNAATAAQNKFNEAWQDMKINLANAGFLDAATSALKDFTTVIKDKEFQDSLKQLINGLNVIITLLGKVALGFLKLPKTIAILHGSEVYEPEAPANFVRMPIPPQPPPVAGRITEPFQLGMTEAMKEQLALLQYALHQEADAIKEAEKVRIKAEEEWLTILANAKAKEASLLMQAMNEEGKFIEQWYSDQIKEREKYLEEMIKIQEAATAKEARLLQEAMEQEGKFIEEAMSKKPTTLTDEMTKAFDGWANNFSSSLNDMLWNADATFGDILESFSKMITQMLIQWAIVEPLFSFVKPYFSSIGNVLTSGRISGQVSGSGSNPPSVSVEVTNNTGVKATATQEGPTWDGQQWVISVWMDAVNRNVGGMRDYLMAGR
jgi:tape measure domain-containing protein